MNNEKLNNSQRKNRHLVVCQEVYTDVMSCKIEYLKHHPEQLGSNISHNHIVKQLAKFYLEQR